MPPVDKFLFDTNGYVVVKGVLTPEEVAAANAAVDSRVSQFEERHGVLRNSEDGTPLAGDGVTPRLDMGGILEWKDAPFRDILVHPKLIPYYRELVGDGYRLDHMPLLIAQDKGSEGFSLHGGPLTDDGSYNPGLQYRFMNGKMWNTMLAVSVQLTSSGPGDGGFCILKGSHKGNYALPHDIKVGNLHLEHLYQPCTEAGDVVLFSEATYHGTLAWNANFQRRVALIRLAPPTVAYGRAYTPEWPEAMLDGMTDAQQAVLAPPYANRLERPQVKEDGALKVQKRAPAKKDFDKSVFKTDFF
ncbi:hypothetical protein CYMTET_27926 [Cymbomonas tetramitiformis]|uniref:Phytanoyl-CoA dioxygenase family protein n=1 Tax=Cymbomonas tetramitiformis TaxID=36881 RepID=A0AAE0FNS6_9CHLO|nr:hypothetical protein CYMTET_27926 [Cymbomonas tetramitiformis]